MPTILQLLTPPIIGALNQAWNDSLPGVHGAHEEGGFIIQDSSANLAVIRWPKGARNSIEVPSHGRCRVAGLEIVASFHTHPNLGSGYLQEPSETDRRAVRDDPDLKGQFYQGELVVSQRLIYLVSPAGTVSVLGETSLILVRT